MTVTSRKQAIGSVWAVSNNSGRISAATPNPGNGLIKAPTHNARSTALLIQAAVLWFSLFVLVASSVLVLIVVVLLFSLGILVEGSSNDGIAGIGPISCNNCVK